MDNGNNDNDILDPPQTSNRFLDSFQQMLGSFQKCFTNQLKEHHNIQIPISSLYSSQVGMNMVETTLSKTQIGLQIPATFHSYLLSACPTLKIMIERERQRNRVKERDRETE